MPERRFKYYRVILSHLISIRISILMRCTVAINLFVASGAEKVAVLGEARAEEFGKRNGVPGELLIRVTPTRVSFAKDIAN